MSFAFMCIPVQDEIQCGSPWLGCNMGNYSSAAGREPICTVQSPHSAHAMSGPYQTANLSAALTWPPIMSYRPIDGTESSSLCKRVWLSTQAVYMYISLTCPFVVCPFKEIDTVVVEGRYFSTPVDFCSPIKSNTNRPLWSHQPRTKYSSSHLHLQTHDKLAFCSIRWL